MRETYKAFEAGINAVDYSLQKNNKKAVRNDIKAVNLLADELKYFEVNEEIRKGLEFKLNQLEKIKETVLKKITTVLISNRDDHSILSLAETVSELRKVMSKIKQLQANIER